MAPVLKLVPSQDIEIICHSAFGIRHSPCSVPRGEFLAVKIVSGGQTGADRAALDFAIAHGLPHGGWCPRGRRAEDGEIPARYQLTEARDRAYAARTLRNVLDSDATVVFSTSPDLRGGTALTTRLAREHNRPLLHLPAALTDEQAATRLRAFLSEHRINTLNIAGPRASQDPNVGDFVTRVLTRTFQMTSQST